MWGCGCGCGVGVSVCVYLSVCLSVCQSVYLSVFLSVCQFVCLSVCLPLLLTVHPLPPLAGLIAKWIKTLASEGRPTSWRLSQIKSEGIYISSEPQEYFFYFLRTNAHICHWHTHSHTHTHTHTQCKPTHQIQIQHTQNEIMYTWKKVCDIFFYMILFLHKAQNQRKPAQTNKLIIF